MVSRIPILRVFRVKFAWLVFAMCAFLPVVSAQQKPSIAGDYSAKVDETFTLRLHLKFNAEGALTGSIDLPDEYEMGDVLKDVHFDGGTLSFSVTGHTGVWEGTLSSNGNSLVGKWTEWGVATAWAFMRDAPSAVAKVSPVDGIWLGALPAGAASLRIQVIVKSDAAGHLSCTVDSPDQRVMGMACAHAAFSGDDFSFDIPAVFANWSGRLSADGKALTGTLTQGGAMALNFQRQSRCAGSNACCPRALRRSHSPG